MCSKRGVFPMLCLMDSIRQDEPAVQRLLHAVDEAHTLTEIILAVWPLARVLAMHSVEAVLAERALSPTFWPRCPTCGAFLRSKGFVKRQVLSLFGPICWRRRVGRCPQGCAPPLWPHWMKPWVCALISGPVMSSSIWAVRWPCLCRLRRRRCCCGGIARGRSVPRPCGSGSKRQGGGPWRSSTSSSKQ